MGLVMRDDGQGLDEYDVVTIMIMFDIDCDNDTIRRLYKAGPFCRNPSPSAYTIRK